MPAAIRSLVAAIAAALALPAAAQAQLRTLERVTVEATTSRPLPTAQSPEKDELAARSAATRDTTRLLTTIPGVSARGAGGVSSLPMIRGLADDRLRVQVDGMDLISTCPNHMNAPLSYLAPAQVATIGVHTTIVPVSAGGDHIGGAISIETAPPRFARDGEGLVAGGELGTNVASNGRAIGADVALTVAGEMLQVGYTANTASAGNHRAGGDFKTFTATGREGGSLPRDEIGSSAYRTRNQQATLAWRQGAHLVELRVGAQDMPFQNFPNQRMDLTDNTQRRYQLRWRAGFDAVALDARFWHESVAHEMDFGEDKRFWYGTATTIPGVMGVGRACSPISPTCAAGMPMIAESRTNAARAAVEWTLTETDRLRLGAEAQAYRLEDYWPASGANMWPGTFVNINEGRRDRRGLFAEWAGSQAPGWQHLVGVRVERVETNAGEVRGYDIDPAPPGSFMMTAADAAAFNALERRRRDTNWDLAAMIRRSFDDHLEAEVGLFRRSRSPNLYERYTWSTWEMAAGMNNTVGDGNGYVGDPNLRPEVAHGIAGNLAWKAAPESWRVAVSPHYTRVRNYIDAVRITNRSHAFNVLRHANVDARLIGVDVSASSRVFETDVGRFELTATASTLDGENRDTGDSLYQIVPFRSRIGATHRTGAWHTTLELEGVARKDDVSKVRNEIVTPGYGLVHLRSSWTGEAFRVDFGVENVFDRLYRLPEGGAYLGQGPTMMLNGVPWGIAVPGPGRSFYAAVRVNF